MFDQCFVSAILLDRVSEHGTWEFVLDQLAVIIGPLVSPVHRLLLKSKSNDWDKDTHRGVEHLLIGRLVAEHFTHKLSHRGMKRLDRIQTDLVNRWISRGSEFMDDQHREFTWSIRTNKPLDERLDARLQSVFSGSIFWDTAIEWIQLSIAFESNPPYLDIQLQFGVEVVVHRGDIDLRLLANRRDRGAAIAFSTEQVDRNFEDPLFRICFR